MKLTKTSLLDVAGVNGPFLITSIFASEFDLFQFEVNFSLDQSILITKKLAQKNALKVCCLTFSDRYVVMEMCSSWHTWKKDQKWNLGTWSFRQNVALNLLYGYPTLPWPRDHNNRNCCPKINYHPDPGNKWYCQFSKTMIKVRLSILKD